MMASALFRTSALKKMAHSNKNSRLFSFLWYFHHNFLIYQKLDVFLIFRKFPDGTVEFRASFVFRGLFGVSLTSNWNE
jgi:hypothetical protein